MISKTFLTSEFVAELVALHSGIALKYTSCLLMSCDVIMRRQHDLSALIHVKIFTSQMLHDGKCLERIILIIFPCLHFPNKQDGDRVSEKKTGLAAVGETSDL